MCIFYALLCECIISPKKFNSIKRKSKGLGKHNTFFLKAKNGKKDSDLPLLLSVDNKADSMK